MDLAKIPEARKAGYSDREIADFLAVSNPKIGAARDAGYSDAEIIGHLEPKRSLGRKIVDTAGDVADTVGDALKTASNYRDTQFSKAMGGVAGLPRAAADAMKWVSGKTGVPLAGFGPVGAMAAVGEHLPTSKEVGDFMLGMRKPDPSFRETNINPVVDAGVQALFAGPVLGMGGKMGPVLNASAAMGSETAGQLTEGTKYEVPARLAGGVIAGTGAALAPKVIDKAGSLVRPFTEAGRDQIVGKTLNRVASDADSALTKLESYSAGREAYPNTVPGFRLDAGRASRDPGLMAAAEVVPQRVRGPMAQENNTALTDALERAGLGLPPAATAGDTIQSTLRKGYDDLVKARSEAVKPLYESARKSPEPVKPFPLMAYTADTIAANKGEPAAVMEQARKLLFTTDKNGRVIPDRSARGMMATRDALNDMLSDQNLGNHARSLLMEMKGKVDEALNAVPQAKVANAKFAEMSRPLDPFNADLGNKLVAGAIERDQFNKGFLMPAEKVPEQFMKSGNMSGPAVDQLMMAGGNNPAIRDAMRSAYLSDFRKAASSAAQEDAKGNKMLLAAPAAKWMENHRAGASKVLAPEQVAALDDVIKHLKEQAQTIPGRTGSQTFDRLATESILGSWLSQKAPLSPAVNKLFGFAYDGANAQTMERLFEVLQDPALTKALMRKATEQNVKLAEPVARKLLTSSAYHSRERGSQ